MLYDQCFTLLDIKPQGRLVDFTCREEFPKCLSLQAFADLPKDATIKRKLPNIRKALRLNTWASYSTASECSALPASNLEPAVAKPGSSTIDANNTNPARCAHR
jgi:hypothetical protein